jgi:hypothetical protein
VVVALGEPSFPVTSGLLAGMVVQAASIKMRITAIIPNLNFGFMSCSFL